MRRRPLLHAARALLATAVTAAAVLAVPGAEADTAQPRIVSANPVDWTPHILDGTVWTITVVGETVIVGGNFTTVTNSTGTRRYARRNIFAYGLRDGAIRTAFAPTVDGPVYALVPGAGNTVYVGGAFRRINGARQRGLARLRVASGTRLTRFNASINWGDVRALAVHGARLYLGGTFSAVNRTTRRGLARLNATSGAVDRGFDARLAAPGLPRVRIEDFALSPSGRRLVIIGAFFKVAGADRAQIAILDTSGRAAVPMSWYTDAYRGRCGAAFATYLRQVDFAHDGSYFVVVSTGGKVFGPTVMCNSAARFSPQGRGRHAPMWVNRTGGDSLYAVSITGAAIYVGGHQRWLDNPYGRETAGPGAVSRPGIAAISPRTGRAVAWNPTRTRGVGVRALVATSAGLLVGSDTDNLGREYHARIGMFPL